jgi:hypothetical protein
MQPGFSDAGRARVRVSFDRGTLLLEGSGSSLARTLPGVLFDPRVGRVRAPAHLWPQVRTGLEAIGVQIDDRVSAHRWHSPQLSIPSLRSYQQHAVSAWELAGRRGIVVLPTGAGKTRVAIAAIAMARTSTLIVVPTRVLLDQWRSVLQEVTSAPIGQLGDGRREVRSIHIADTIRPLASHHAQRSCRTSSLLMNGFPWIPTVAPVGTVLLGLW